MWNEKGNQREMCKYTVWDGKIPSQVIIPDFFREREVATANAKGGKSQKTKKQISRCRLEQDSM